MKQSKFSKCQYSHQSIHTFLKIVLTMFYTKKKACQFEAASFKRIYNCYIAIPEKSIAHTPLWCCPLSIEPVFRDSVSQMWMVGSRPTCKIFKTIPRNKLNEAETQQLCLDYELNAI